MKTRPEFNLERPFVVTAAGGATFNGHRYRAGEPFPWKQLGISEAALWELWLMFQVDNVSDRGASAAPSREGAIPDVAAGPPRSSSADGAPNAEPSPLAAAVTPTANSAPDASVAAPVAAAGPRPPTPPPSAPRAAAKSSLSAKPAKPQQPNPLLAKR